MLAEMVVLYAVSKAMSSVPSVGSKFKDRSGYFYVVLDVVISLVNPDATHLIFVDLSTGSKHTSLLDDFLKKMTQVLDHKDPRQTDIFEDVT